MRPMRYDPMLVVLATLAVVVVSCHSAGQQKVAQVGPQAPFRSAHWTGTLTAPSGTSGALDVRGIASVVRSGPGGSAVTVVISNAVPLGFHPWEVYRGQCGHDASLIGALGAYPWLAVKGDGTASATATLAGEQWSGDYHVNVNASPDLPATIIACGNIAAPAEPIAAT
jgi:hypothetical protein